MFAAERMIPYLYHLFKDCHYICFCVLLLDIGICLLTLLNGHLDPSMCKFRYAVYVFVAGTCIVLGAFIFGLTTTQSLMKDFGYTPSAQSVVNNLSPHCLASD